MGFRAAVIMVAALLLACSACGTAPTTTSAGEAGSGPEHLYESKDGQQIVVVNGSAAAIRLLDWTFSRFLAADLEEPPIERINFGPDTPGCASAAGWAKVTDGGVEIAICLAGQQVCSGGITAELTNQAKFCALHELAHGWMVAFVPAETEAAFLDHTGLDVWISTGETPWHERGVEYGAEVMAWGLMDTRLGLVRIKPPNCRHLETGFTILTGVAPLVRCDIEGSYPPAHTDRNT